ncbi:protein 5NUC-like [Haemaphysalis longicornis]
MTLFSGDVYQGHIWFRIRKEQVVVQMMNQLSFDAMSLGISEFYNGPRGLTPLFANLTKETRLVLCNADFSNDPHLNELPNTPQRSFEKVMAGVRVGVIGYIHEEVRVHGQPGPTITFTNPRDCLQEEARKLRSKGVSVVIALGGGNPDLDRHLAENVTEVDAFVVSYKDRFAYPSTQENLLRKAPDLDYPIKVDRANGTGYIFVATNHYQFLGRFTITVRWRDRKVLSASGRPELLDKYSAEGDCLPPA